MTFIKVLLLRNTVKILSFFLLLSFSGCKKDFQQISTEEATSSAPSSIQAEGQPGINYVPNEVLVKFSKELPEDKKATTMAKIGGKVVEKILTKTMKKFGNNEGVYLITTPLAVLEAISKIKGIEIEYAEPNYIYTHEATSNDSYYTNGSLWGMYGDGTIPSNQYGSQAGEAWAVGHTGSSNVFVGVIDEGVMFNHTDISANFWTNPFDPIDGIDNDLNGYIDDVYGWDFAGNNNSVFDGTADDHGTHVSGTIGAKGGNGAGVVGVNWSVKIISAKFLGTNGGTTANAIKAIDYITDLKTRHGLNIVATNNSWGGGGFSSSLQAAIERSNTANILFVAAAGNSGLNIDVSASYPAGYDNANIISVAAITSTGALASYSNYGITKVDIGAPGSGVFSTIPTAGKGKNKFTSSYASYSGTSMATPHVTGACALYASTHIGANAAAIKSAILASAVSTASLTGKCVTGGRLNVSGF